MDSQHNYGSGRKCSNPGSNNRDFKYPGSSELLSASVDSQHNYGSGRKCSNPGSNNRAFDEVILVQCCLEVMRHILVSEGVASAVLCLMRKLASGLLIGSIRKWGPYLKSQVWLCKFFLGKIPQQASVGTKESPVALEKVAEWLCCDINCAFPYNQDHARVKIIPEHYNMGTQKMIYLQSTMVFANTSWN